MTAGDRGLQREGTQGSRQRLGARARVEPAGYPELRPARPVLIQKENGLTGGTDARSETRRLDLHQGDEPVDLGFLRNELGQDAPKPHGLVAKPGTRPVVALGCRVPLVEDQVNGLEHRRQARRQLRPTRHLERYARLGERALRPDDALRDRGLGHEEGPGDLVARQPSEQAQRERHARLGREDGVAGNEHEPKQIITDVLVDGCLDIRARRSQARGGFVPELVVLAVPHLPPPELIDRAVLRGGHEPRAGVLGDAHHGPSLHRGHERLLREVLGEPDVAHHARKAAYQPCGFNPPDGLDGLARGAHDLFCRATSARSRSSCARNSGESSLPKSSGSKTGRRVTSTPPSNGARLSHSTASSIEFTCQIQ